LKYLILYLGNISKIGIAELLFLVFFFGITLEKFQQIYMNIRKNRNKKKKSQFSNLIRKIPNNYSRINLLILGIKSFTKI